MKKQFFTKHAKSSAALVSLGIHAVLIVIALSFVAVKVVLKPEQSFKSTQVNRPKMQLKKLQVPVNIKKSAPKPKLRKRIVVKPRLNQNMPDIKMPEISGAAGGVGGAGGGLGGAGGIGFSMPEINLFGVKSKGEKICIILDSDQGMMLDEMGGIPAYTIIKEELVRILEGIPSSALVNVMVFDVWNSYACFPDLVPATAPNVARIDEWIRPLNAVRPGMGTKEYGVGTLGKGGIKIEEDFATEKLKDQKAWHRPAMFAMQQQADTVFLLTGGWGPHWNTLTVTDNSEWNDTPAGKRYWEAYEEAQKLLEKENKERADRGEPPRVLDGRIALMQAYFPNVPGPPPNKTKYFFTPKDFSEAMLESRQQYSTSAVQAKSGLQNKQSRDRFSFNVVHFRPVGDRGVDENLKALTKLRRGDYQSIAGLKAIKSSIGTSE